MKFICKSIKLTLFASLLLLTTSVAISQTTFELALGGTANEQGYAVAKSTRGTYGVTGFTDSYGVGNWDVYVADLDSFGNTQWAFAYGGAGDDRARTIKPTSDGGYIMGGETFSFSGRKSFVMKIDSVGNLSWVNYFGFSGTSRCFEIFEHEGVFYATGDYQPASDDGDTYLAAFDLVGNTLWNKGYNSGNDDEGGFSLKLAYNGGFIISVKTNDYGAGNYEYMMFKTDATGGLEWAKTYGGGAIDYNRSIVNGIGGGYLIAGYTFSYGVGDNDAMLVKTDTLGNLEWVKTYGDFGSDFAQACVTVTPDNHYLMIATTDGLGAAGEDICVTKLDSLGNIVWSKLYGGPGNDHIIFGENDPILVDEKGIHFVGRTTSYGAGSGDIFYVRADLNGDLDSCTVTSVTPVVTTPTINVNSYTFPEVAEIPWTSGTFTRTIICGTATTVCPSSFSTLPTVVSADTTICEGDSVRLLATNATSVLWTPSATLSDTTVFNPIAFPTTNTTYYLIDTLCGLLLDSVTVTVAPNPIATATGDTSICIGDTATISASGGVSYSWSPGASLSDSTIAGPLAFPAVTTTYTVTVANAAGCTDTASWTLDAILCCDPDIQIVGEDSISCVGDTLTLFASGIDSVLWSTGETSDTIRYYSATTAIVWVQSLDPACPESDTMLIVALPPVSVSIFGDSIICEGETAVLNASGAPSYQWVSPDTSTSAIGVSPTITTEYYVTGSNGGCFDSDTFTVTVIPLPETDILGDTALCIGESTTLWVGGSENVIWLTSATTDSITVSPAISQSYWVQQDSAGCASSDTIFVFVEDSNSIELFGDTAFCQGGTATLTAISSVTPLWSTGANTANIMVSPGSTTTYWAEQSNMQCPTVYDSALVVVIPIPSISIATTDSSLCTGDSTLLQGIGAYDSIFWSNGSSTNNIWVSPLSSQGFTATVFDSVCTNSDLIYVIVGDSNQIAIMPDTFICVGNTVELQAIASGLVNWSTGDTGTSLLVSPGTNTNYFAFTDNGLCPAAYDSLDIDVLPLPIVDISPGDTAICSGDAFTATATGSFDSLMWSNGASTASLNLSPATSTVLYVTAYDSICTATDSIPIIVGDSNFISVASDTFVCAGLPVTLLAHAAAIVNWSTGDTGTTLTVIPGTTTQYWAFADNGLCPAVYDSLEVIVLPQPSLNLSPFDTIVCTGATVVATAGGSYDSLWWSNGVNTASQTLNPTTDLSLYVTAYDSICGTQDSLVIMVADSNFVEIVGDTFICVGDTIELTANGSGGYTWTTGTTSATISVSPDTATIYSVVAANGICPPAGDQHTVNVGSVSLPLIDTVYTMDPWGSVGIDVGDSADSYLWLPFDGVSCPDCPDPVFTPSTTTAYTLQVCNEGCCDELGIRIIVSNECAKFAIPTAFSPNDDGVNDFFYLIHDGGFVDFEEMRIYNRWGEKIFETNDVNDKWDGTYLGVDQPIGAFVFYVSYRCNGELEIEMGSVTLIR